MMKLAEATRDLDVYIVASNNAGGSPGRGGRGERGGERAGGRGGDPAAGRGGDPAGRGEAGARGAAAGRGGGGRGPQGPAQRHSTMANLACYPALNVPTGFADNGQPTNVTFFARPFGEAPLLALAKAYQDAAGFHLVRPTKLDAMG
jgi:hypothetical protein